MSTCGVGRKCHGCHTSVSSGVWLLTHAACFWPLMGTVVVLILLMIGHPLAASRGFCLSLTAHTHSRDVLVWKWLCTPAAALRSSPLLRRSRQLRATHAWCWRRCECGVSTIPRGTGSKDGDIDIPPLICPLCRTTTIILYFNETTICTVERVALLSFG